ncbi:hypothetical protein [Adhaeretor mobilis]|uniref:Uncharacterized protein n=1 Tax=Adhaeretor mobilis TaxID=1930276 RepID=A0A517MQW3_9BACT|nr:hypothetical protein [Adhaeretor mobilis]QDS97278.1 hypothetical protein HG15A2_05390 [Adhaeretor mobilis]
MSKNAAGVVRLAAASLVLGLIWCVALPQFAATPRMHARIEWLEERGIDPSAMYYTELEAMRPILRRLEGHGTGVCSRD